MVAALYGRVSTADKNQDVNLQLDELRAYAIKRGWQCIEYIDDGVTGASTKRPALDKLMLDAKKRRLDVVIVWKLDRLGRSLSHLLLMLNEFQALGVDFVSIRESIDMTTPSGKLMAHLLGAFAEFERSLISERVKAGIAHAQKKGIRVGRKPISDAVKDKVILLADSEPDLSVRKISKRTEIPPATVHRILQEYRQCNAA